MKAFLSWGIVADVVEFPFHRTTWQLRFTDEPLVCLIYIPMPESFSLGTPGTLHLPAARPGCAGAILLGNLYFLCVRPSREAPPGGRAMWGSAPVISQRAVMTHALRRSGAFPFIDLPVFHQLADGFRQ
mgnify:CR=1 FL=1